MIYNAWLTTTRLGELKRTHALQWLLAGLLLAAMFLPLWFGMYPPLYDYPNHLLEAQVVAHYNDPRFGYAAVYDLQPLWYLRSNALSTLLLVGLGKVMPITLVGQLVASLYIVLFVSGLLLLLRRMGTAWPLLLLAPVLAYNLSFTSGWLNFAYGAALSLHALIIYLRWQEHGRRLDLALLALLMLLIATAHLLAWGLILLVIASMASIEDWPLRRYGALFLALNSALPMIMVTRPELALAAGLIAPMLWIGAVLLRRMRVSRRLLVVGTPLLALAAAVLIKVLQSFYQSLAPEVHYDFYTKRITPLQLFTIPHQSLPLDIPLLIINGALLMLLAVLVCLLLWSSLRQRDSQRDRWLAALGVLLITYVLLPSRTSEIWIIEPRVLLFAVFVGLAMVRLPPVNSRLYRLVVICALLTGLLGMSGMMRSTWTYEQKTRAWRQQLEQLAPARSVLLLRGISASSAQPQTIRAFNTLFAGEHFITTYTIDHGGFTPRIFDSGPVRPRATISIPLYYWSHFDSVRYVADQCQTLRTMYDAVLVWGRPADALTAQLNTCFGPGLHMQDSAIWRK